MLTDDAFARLVAEDVKNRVTHEQRDYLRLPENRERWRRGLVALIENLNDQIGDLERAEDRETKKYASLGKDGKRLLLESQMSFEERKKKVSRFRFYVEQRLAEVDRMTALGDEALEGDIRLASFLRKAIEAHRSFMVEWDMEATDIDEALWAALEGEWRFSDLEAISD